MIQISSPQKNVLGQVSMAVKTPEIQSITILEGDQGVTASEVIQYVNLPRDSKFVNPAHGISHIDRLGRKIRCKVTFNVVGHFKFKVKLNPKSSNVVYTATEKANTNNINFCYSKDGIEFTTDSTGEKIIEADQLFVTPAGNDVFTISAEDSSGNIETTTTEIRTRRMMYYQFAMMPGSTIPDLTACFVEYFGQGIAFERLPPITITDRNVVPGSETGPFIDELKNISSPPYGIVLALAKNVGNIYIKPEVQNGYFNGITKVRLSYKDPLWIENNNIAGSDWFFDGVYDINGQKGKITKNMCTPAQSDPKFMTGWYDCIDVDINSLPVGTGEIKVALNLFQIKGGFSIGNTNIIVLGTKILGQDISSYEQIPITIHEIGHQLGQVVDGKNGLPDPSPTLYTGRGHNGNHCYMGVGPKLPTDKYDQNDMNFADCVMFGAVSGETSFCINCKTGLKKIDLSIFPVVK